MINLDQDLLRMVRRNKLLGMWAAQKLGLVGESADVYSNDLATGTLDLERVDVHSKIRNDFDAAGVVQSDEEILRVMNEFWLEASCQTQTRRGDSSDAAMVQIARNLMTKQR
ncbi:MAG TPA: ATPase inhibitor subunit zeta [Rhizobiaceae bacterium]|nr:ATPase inhibitor subunit zeta [Rhizobiaceae bacterium]